MMIIGLCCPSFRYLFIRCDNSPAPWSSTESGDAPNLKIPDIAAAEIKLASGKVHEMCSDSYWSGPAH